MTSYLQSTTQPDRGVALCSAPLSICPIMEKHQSPRRIVLWSLTAAWLASIAVGSVAFLRYDITAGVTGDIAEQWPVAGDTTEPTKHPVVLLFAHPKCPCTRAALDEFANMFEQDNKQCHLRVVFVHPPGAPARWSEGPNWERAHEIPGVSVEVDRDGNTARAFGVRTSGHVLVYAGNGELLFSGGLTGGRTASGRRTGAGAVLLDVLDRGGSPPVRCDVFGCPLFDEPEGNP